jgi:hypothetical protein
MYSIHRPSVKVSPSSCRRSRLFDDNQFHVLLCLLIPPRAFCAEKVKDSDPRRASRAGYFSGILSRAITTPLSIAVRMQTEREADSDDAGLRDRPRTSRSSASLSFRAVCKQIHNEAGLRWFWKDQAGFTMESVASRLLYGTVRRSKASDCVTALNVETLVSAVSDSMEAITKVRGVDLVMGSTNCRCLAGDFRL